MNPYDCSSTVTVANCLTLWGTEAFSEEFLNELSEQDSELPLDELCDDRGYACLEKMVWLTDLNFTGKEPPIVTGDFRVHFTAMMPTGCRDASGEFRVDKRLSFKLSLDSGLVEFEQPHDYTDYGH
jgi:hypothetical protein